MTSILHLPPPIELAVGQLSSAEQSHVQVSLRVLEAHLKARCILVNKGVADITLTPNDNDAGTLRAFSAYDQILIERPIRLVPLSESLSFLIEGILSRTAQASSVTPQDDTAVTPASPSALLDLLLNRSPSGPIEIQMASGYRLLVDARYTLAHLSSPVGEMLPRLAADRILSTTPVSEQEFAQRTAKGNPLHPVSVEQICWALPATVETAPALARWHRDAQARVKLETWPNLSAQDDAQAWLGLLAKLFQRDMRVGDLRDAAVAAGIAAERANHGISLLLTYRHAHIMAAAEMADSVVVRLPLPRRTTTASPSLLGRLRSRLRAMAA